MTIITEPELAENEYITDLGIEIRHALTHLQAPTGRGKSTFIIEEFAKTNKVILVCPVKVQVAQIASDFKDNKKVQCFTGEETTNALHGDVIVCVYDKLATLLEQNTYLKDYVLVVDEAHKIYQAAGYREQALSVVLDAIIDKTFKQVITISATFQTEIFPLEFDEQILISHAPTEKPDVDVIYYKNYQLLEEALIQISPSDGKVAMVRINNKEQIRHAKICFEQQGLRVLEIHSEIQKSDDVVQLLETSEVTDYDIVLTTSLLDEAINIKNENIESVHVFRKLPVDELKQFIGRCRRSTPQVYLHLLNSDLNRCEIDFDHERRKVEALSQASLDYALLLCDGKNSYTRAVRDVNATTKHHHNFMPLHYEYGNGEPPKINKIAILSKLYNISMEAQYVNDASLNVALMRGECFGEISFFDSEHVVSDEESNAIISRASNMQMQARNAAIDQCLSELGCSSDDLSNLTVDAVKDLSERYEQSGLMGDISKSWSSLSLILPVEQALDAICHDRQKEIWKFHEAVTKRLDTRPYFEALREDIARDGMVELIGADAINDYFINALRIAAKKQEGFKKYIRKLNITGLEVQENNKFKLSSRYLYAFIRDFTDFEERRSGGVQSFTIKGIGLFGYDYKIRELMTSSPKRPKRNPLFSKKVDGDELPF